MDSSENAETILAMLRRHPFFEQASSEELEAVFRLMTPCHYICKESIVQEGKLVDSIQLIISGQAEVTQKGLSEKTSPTVITVLEAGDIIGLTENGYFSKSGSRQATVTALNPVETMRLSTQAILQLQKSHPSLFERLHSETRLLDRMQFIRRMKHFKPVTLHELRQIALLSREIAVEANDDIFKAGDKSDSCYFILEGSVNISHHGKQLATLYKGDLFGEIGLLLDQPRTATARTQTGCRLLVLEKNDLQTITQTNKDTKEELLALIRDRSRLTGIQSAEIIPKTFADGTISYYLKNTETLELFKLTEEGLFLWKQINGNRTFGDLIRLFAFKYEGFSASSVQSLILELIDSGFIHIEGFQSHAHKKTEQTNLPSTVLRYIPKIMEAFYSFKNADHFITRTYPLFRWFYTRPAQVSCLVFLLLGLSIFIYTSTEAISFLPQLPAHSLLFLYFILAIAIFIHEFAHAYTTKHFKYPVLGMGVGWFWIAPTAFCDTTQTLLADKRTKIFVDGSGVYTQAIFTSIVLIIGWAIGTPLSLTLSWAFYLISMINVIYNLSPILDIDGYFLLQDLTDDPDLRENALLWLIQKDRIKRLFHPAERIKHRHALLYWLAMFGYTFLIIPILAITQTMLLGKIFPELAQNGLMWILPVILILLFFLTVWGKLREIL